MTSRNLGPYRNPSKQSMARADDAAPGLVPEPQLAVHVIVPGNSGRHPAEAQTELRSRSSAASTASTTASSHAAREAQRQRPETLQAPPRPPMQGGAHRQLLSAAPVLAPVSQGTAGDFPATNPPDEATQRERSRSPRESTGRPALSTQTSRQLPPRMPRRQRLNIFGNDTPNSHMPGAQASN